MNRHVEGNCLAFTTRELETIFGRRFENSADGRLLLDIFHFADEVKFGGRESLREKRLQDIGLAAAITSRLENSKSAAKKEARHAYV
jgi:hypothetical protein